MTLPLEETADQTLSLKAKAKIRDFSKKCDVAAIGPGLGSNNQVSSLVKELLVVLEVPVVLDADGINALGGELELLKKRELPTVVTPHPGEMSRLTGKDIAEVQSMRGDVAKSVAEITGTIVCLKGHATVVASPDGRIYINDTGNSGMATGGAGDILTGMIASFIGQGVDVFSAAVSAVYLHGLAGDIAAEEKGQFCMIASDILACLPAAFKKSGI